jgi:formylglycine-generating enzyme required for sulfatase activity
MLVCICALPVTNFSGEVPVLSEDDQDNNKSLVPHSRNGLIVRSSGLARRGLNDLARRAVDGQHSALGTPADDPFKELRELAGQLAEDYSRPDLEINSLGMEFILIPVGGFMMGSDLKEDEKPIHEVTITKPFYLGRYPITQFLWLKIMGNNPSKDVIGNDYPVHGISWHDAKEFVRRMNIDYPWLSGNSNDQLIEYRLPTEAEWEYACRAGTTGDYAGDLDLLACHLGHDLQPVGSKNPNAFGLFDMHGSVLEWCEDHYHQNYEGAPADGSAWISGGPDAKINRVARGGSFASEVAKCRSAARSWGTFSATAGLRLVAIK